MSTQAPRLITENNLSHAWGKAFLHTVERSTRNLTPLMISVGGFSDGVPSQDPRLEEALDGVLKQNHRYLCRVSAMTIFPFREWNRYGRPARAEFFQWYLRDFLPRLKKRDQRNVNGTYFERMIDFKGVKTVDGKLVVTVKNQLDQVISDWHRPRAHRKRPRQSALQVACFDPPKDHTGQSVRGFPCLQQVSFTYDDNGGLALSAFYPTQYIVDRAYGNYQGLCNLGYFMAHELGLKLVRFNCFIGRPELGTVKKHKLADLHQFVRKMLPPGSTSEPDPAAASIAGTLTDANIQAIIPTPANVK